MEKIRTIIFSSAVFPMLMLSASAGSLLAEENFQATEVGYEEKLGQNIPLDITLIDEYGKPVSLRSLFNKPAILSLVYYRCPGICSPLLNSLSETVDRLDMEPGRDYNIVTISFDVSESYTTASEKKKNYLDNLSRRIPEDSWRFLTGDSASISRITDAVGFRYQPQGSDFMHGAGIVVLSSSGKITRYLYGINFVTLDLKLALIEASEERVGATINKLLKLCYSYDPAGRKYVLNITRITGSVIFTAMAVFLAVLLFKKKKSKPVNTGKEEVKNV